MNSRTIPLILFVLLVILLLVGLDISDRKTIIPSPLIGKPAPSFSLPVLGSPDQVMSKESLLGEPYLVNFWASWCVSCRVEHPAITELAKRKLVTIVGLNFRDETADANAWLNQFGNPYDVNLSDLDGRVSIDFGVYAAPETFLVDPSGTIVYKYIGPLTSAIIDTDILPLIASMESAGR
jgi:cytochrome c biogenesis protein CcmG/thiol:disulfide interchange protein DsbE